MAVNGRKKMINGQKIGVGKAPARMSRGFQVGVGSARIAGAVKPPTKKESNPMASERNLTEEVNHLSGCVFAHDVVSLHLAKILIASGTIESFDLETILFDAEMESNRLPEEVQEGYRETLHKLQENLQG